RRSSGRLAHHETAAGYARRRLALMRHRGAADVDQQIVETLRHQHAVGQVIEAARTGDVRPAPDHAAGDMVLDRPAVDADGVRKARAGNDIVGGQLVLSHNPPRFAYAELRRDVDDIGVGESGRLALEKLEEGERLLAALDLAGAQFAGVGAVDRAAIRALHLR